MVRPARSVHTLGMRFPIDVAFCDADLRVLRIVRMPRHRVSRVVWRARAVIEAEAGSCDRWKLRPGDEPEGKGPGTATGRRGCRRWWARPPGTWVSSPRRG